MRNKPKVLNTQALTDLITGCILGGAIGDALGYPVEFMIYSEILNKYGENGITEFALQDGRAQISDDTQMTLFTANALIFARTKKDVCGHSDDISHYIFKAYRNWYATQIPHADSSMMDSPEKICWIYNDKRLHALRAPGNTCIDVLKKDCGYGTMDNPINDSKGCGGAMRVAPVGCLYAPYGKAYDAAREGAKAAALTHGHPLGYIPAAFLSSLVCNIIYDRINSDKKDLLTLVNDTKHIIRKMFGHKQHYDEFEDIIDKAIALSQSDETDITAIRTLGEGWTGEEALAIAIYSALKYPCNFKKGVICAVNHNGDSDSTGSVTGNILGAYLGMFNIDCTGKVYTKLEPYDVMFEIAQDLALVSQMYDCSEYKNAKWFSKYIYCNYGK